MQLLRGAVSPEQPMLTAGVFLRLQRRHAVANRQQWLFAYRCVLHWLQPFVISWSLSPDKLQILYVFRHLIFTSPKTGTTVWCWASRCLATDSAPNTRNAPRPMPTGRVCR
jgi:hypothetical protein